MNTPFRTWLADGFRLEMSDTGRWDRRGVEYVAYRLYHNDAIVFEGDDYSPSPLHDRAGDDSLAGLLVFLSLRPGDTDPEYFDGYTPEQLAFAQAHGEELSLYAYDLEG